MRSELEPRLSRLYRTPATGQAEHERAHEDALVAAVARRRAEAGLTRSVGPARRRPVWLRMPRLALAGMLGVAVAVGACVMPSEYPVSLGYGLELTLTADRFATLDPPAIAHYLQDVPGVEHVEVRVRHDHAESIDDAGEHTASDDVRMQLFVFGDALDPDALMTELETRFPVLAGAALHDVPLSGTVRGTLGGELSHRLLDLTIDRHGVAEAERQVLAALVAEGIDPEHATVDITEQRGADGERRIEVRIEAERSGDVPEP